MRTTFFVTELLVSLVREMRIVDSFSAYPHVRPVDASDVGAPCVDPHKPYGSEDVYEDIARIIGNHWDEQEGDFVKFEPINSDEPGNNFSSKELTRMNLYHLQTETALQILVDTFQLSVGEYEKEEGGKWVKVNS